MDSQELSCIELDILSSNLLQYGAGPEDIAHELGYNPELVNRRLFRLDTDELVEYDSSTGTFRRR